MRAVNTSSELLNQFRAAAAKKSAKLDKAPSEVAKMIAELEASQTAVVALQEQLSEKNVREVELPGTQQSDGANGGDGSPRSRLNCAINEKAKLSAESDGREARTFAMFEESVRELAIAKTEKAEFEDLVIRGVRRACDHVRSVEGSVTDLKCTAAEAEAELAQQHSEVLALLQESEARNASLEMKLFAVQTSSPSAASVEV